MSKNLTPQDIIQIAVKALDDKKAKDIEVIEIEKITTIADFFVIATGSSSTQVKSLANEVEHKLSELGLEPHHIEGKSTGWILLDYNGVIIHVFHTEMREFYDLSRMWADGAKHDIDEYLK